MDGDPVTLSTSEADVSCSVDLSSEAVPDLQPWLMPRCFVVHAWSPPYHRHVVHLIRQALQGNFFVNADLDFGGNTCIRRAALKGIEEASLVICLLDGLTPNVTFEYGYAEALHKPCIPMLANNAVVDIERYFPAGHRPDGLRNPALCVDDHFSDFRNTVYCRYDPQDPAAPSRTISEQLDKINEKGDKLDRRILNKWVELLKERYEKRDAFKPVFKYILETGSIRLGTPLFATRRKHHYEKLLNDAFQKLL